MQGKRLELVAGALSARRFLLMLVMGLLRLDALDGSGLRIMDFEWGWGLKGGVRDIYDCESVCGGGGLGARSSVRFYYLFSLFLV